VIIPVIFFLYDFITLQNRLNSSILIVETSGGELIHFRRANISDADQLISWRNDPETRSASIDSSPVTLDTHQRWMQASLSNPDRQIFIAEIDQHPIGTVRLDRRGGDWELSWTVAPDSRGKGLGRQMVKMATTLVSGTLVARVKESNEVSHRIAKFSGFVPTKNEDGVVTYVLNHSTSRD